MDNKTFKVCLLNTCADPIEAMTFPYGTQFVAGDILETPSGLAVIENIEVTDDYEGCLLAIECSWQWEEQILNQDQQRG